MSLTLVTAPVIEPISVEEAKRQCLVGDDITDQDLHIGDFLVPATRERAESATGRALLTQTWDLVLDTFPNEDFIEIPKPPLVSITSVKYLDMANVLQTWAATNYTVEAPAGPRCQCGRIILPFASIWPIARPQRAAVTIRFVCGNATVAEVPSLLKQAMLMDVATLYANRESVLTGARAQAIELPNGSKSIYQRYLVYSRQRRAS